MNNFGVIEVTGGKTTSAPGWAYVPDVGTGPVPGAAPQAGNRKRARSGPRLSLGDVSARQEAKTRKEVEALDRDGGRDNSIPLPVRSGRAQAKHTPNVRKILQSQKTFANHLDDFLAMQALAEASAAQAQSSGAKTTTGSGSGAARRPSSRQRRIAAAAKRQASTTTMTTTTTTTTTTPTMEAGGETGTWTMNDDDEDALLASRVPEIPSEEELQRLLAMPSLSYLEARGVWGDDDGRYPVRTFCEVCGYWGRVRCIKCGARVCALDCLEAHREGCVTRYGL
ncbi:HIT zinc finger family protein [Ophiocordyceps camponoti-floridani]|uniref:HIT zinc finger family protein n=1 Tax=Ophiocordyceps camponoti-floridani TaxID=2030778 RepID=A0A8H4Q6L0_9HYPO|nr:HIT zinc finger family protein [Ophiocordyceps camponoti-floridani]